MSKTNTKAVFPIFILIIEYLLYLVYNGDLFQSDTISGFSDVVRFASFFSSFLLLVVIMLVNDKEKAFKVTAAGCAALYVLSPLYAFVILSAYIGIVNVDYIFDENRKQDIIRPLFTACFYLLSVVTQIILIIKRWDYISAIYTDKNFIVFYVLFAVFAVIFTALYFALRNKDIRITKKTCNIMLIIGAVFFIFRLWASIHYVYQRQLSESIMFSLAASGIIIYKFFKNSKAEKDG